MQLSFLPDTSVLYAALLNKDSSFEGVFFAAIKTTGIFCRPTCTARKPKKENVEYFGTTKEALNQGYRPCKICEPMTLNGQTPIWLKDLLDHIQSNPKQKLNDETLKTKGLDPTRVRRWFKKNHGMTFSTYLRSMRINSAFGQIREGDQVIQSAYENGFNSLSSFVESFKDATGFSPKESKNRNIITITRIPTILGPMLAGATVEGICLLEFTDRRMLETQIQRLKKYLQAELLPGESPFFEVLTTQLNEYFEGKRKNFTLPLITPGSDFQQGVWKVLAVIPYGKTRSYLDQAKAVGNVKAIRAVAKANGDNRLAILIPCHRVIASDGQMTGYGGGIWRKQWMIEMESKHTNS